MIQDEPKAALVVVMSTPGVVIAALAAGVIIGATYEFGKAMQRLKKDETAQK